MSENAPTYGLTPAQIEGMRATEEAIRAKGLNAPRVTPQDIDDAIKTVHFINAWEAEHRNPAGLAVDELKLLTLCVIVTTNGFTVVGKSACAHPANYDRELGEKIALEDAKRQLWPLLGYALRQRIYEHDVLRVGQPG